MSIQFLTEKDGLHLHLLKNVDHTLIKEFIGTLWIKKEVIGIGNYSPLVYDTFLGIK